MPNGLTITCPGADRFVKLLGRYIEENKRDAGELIKKKAGSVSIELFKATQKAAPTDAKIAADVQSLGWRVKRRKGGWPRRKGEKRGSAGPLRRMQAAQIKRRERARGVAATGWLPGVDKLGGGKAGKKLASVTQPKGSVRIEGIGTAAPRITLSNTTPGINHLEEKNHLLEKAFNAVSKDIETYLQKKSAERAQKLQS